MTKHLTKQEMREAQERMTESELLKLIGHARSVSWKWITADELVSRNPCVLVYIILTAKNNACTVTLHDGFDTQGETIVTLETTANQSRPFSLHGHIMTKQGLYANLSGDVLGILIVYHDVPKSLGG